MTVLIWANLIGCSTPEPSGVDLSIVRATLEVNPNAPDASAELDVALELQARSQPEEVSLREVRITAQPIIESANTLVFVAQMRSPQGDDSVIRIAQREVILARVINGGTTNAELVSWCRAPVRLTVLVSTDDDEEAEADSNITVRCM